MVPERHTITRRECSLGHGKTVGWDPCRICGASSVERTYVAVDALRQFGDGLFPPSREAIRSAIEALTDGCLSKAG